MDFQLKFGTRVLHLPVIRCRFLAIFLVATIAALIMPTALFATTINYGDFPGDTVTYLQVSEYSLGDPLPLFGVPTVTGDSIDFDPTFVASATGAFGVDITDGELLFDVQAESGYVIDTIELSEAGDTTLLGVGTSSFTHVTCSVFVDILAVDGVPIDQINLNGQMVIAPSGGHYVTDASGYRNTIWSGSMSFDLTQALDDLEIEYDDGVTLASVTLDNTLMAMSEEGTYVQIAKKDVDGFSATAETVNAVPEPSSCGVILIGLAVILLVRRSRRS